MTKESPSCRGKHQISGKDATGRGRAPGEENHLEESLSRDREAEKMHALGRGHGVVARDPDLPNDLELANRHDRQCRDFSVVTARPAQLYVHVRAPAGGQPAAAGTGRASQLAY